MRLSLLSSLLLFPFLSLAGSRLDAKIESKKDHTLHSHICALEIDACDTAKGQIILDAHKKCEDWNPPTNNIMMGQFGTGRWWMDFKEPGPYHLMFQNETGPWTVGCMMRNRHTKMGESRGWNGASCHVD